MIVIETENSKYESGDAVCKFTTITFMDITTDIFLRKFHSLHPTENIHECFAES